MPRVVCRLAPETPEALRLSAEQVLEEKLISTLEPVTGAGNVRASVTLDYDQAASEETEETYRSQSDRNPVDATDSRPPAVNPLPRGCRNSVERSQCTAAARLSEAEVVPPESSKEESGTYGVSKSVRHLVQNPGRIRRLTAAIVVNDRMLHAASKGSAAQWQPWAPDALRNLTLLAQAAIGFDTSRGDVLSVEDLTFDENRAPIQASMPREVLTATENSPVLVKYVALLVGLLMVWHSEFDRPCSLRGSPGRQPARPARRAQWVSSAARAPNNKCSVLPNPRHQIRSVCAPRKSSNK